MVITDNDIKVIGRVVSIAADGVVADAGQIQDTEFTATPRTQAQINSHLNELISDVQEYAEGVQNTIVNAKVDIINGLLNGEDIATVDMLDEIDPVFTTTSDTILPEKDNISKNLHIGGNVSANGFVDDRFTAYSDGCIMLTNGKVLSTINAGSRTTKCVPFTLWGTTVTLGGMTAVNAIDATKINLTYAGEMNIGTSSTSGGKLNINNTAYINAGGECYVDGEIIVRNGGNIDVQDGGNINVVGGHVSLDGSLAASESYVDSNVIFHVSDNTITPKNSYSSLDIDFGSSNISTTGELDAQSISSSSIETNELGLTRNNITRRLQSNSTNPSKLQIDFDGIVVSDAGSRSSDKLFATDGSVYDASSLQQKVWNVTNNVAVSLDNQNYHVFYVNADSTFTGSLTIGTDSVSTNGRYRRGQFSFDNDSVLLITDSAKINTANGGNIYIADKPVATQEYVDNKISSSALSIIKESDLNNLTTGGVYFMFPNANNTTFTTGEIIMVEVLTASGSIPNTCVQTGIISKIQRSKTMNSSGTWTSWTQI